jgi:hypothetical protein
MISALIADGKGDFDHSAIAMFVEEASHVEVKIPWQPAAKARF